MALEGLKRGRVAEVIVVGLVVMHARKRELGGKYLFLSQ